MKKIITLITILFASKSWAITATSDAIVVDNIATKPIQAYAKSSLNSTKVGVVKPETELILHQTFIKTKPGLATMEEAPKDKAIPFDRGANVYIYEYLENGYSKIRINGIEYMAKIARSYDECNRIPYSPKYCWAKVLKRPEYYEWLRVSLNQDGNKFWILNRIIDGSGIVQIKDEAISKTRVVRHKTIHKYENTPKKITEEEVITQKEPLFDESMLDNIKMPKDPLARAMVENMLKPSKKKDEKKITTKDQKKKEKKEISQREMFKQTSAKSLTTNFNKDISTVKTINKINSELADSPAEKLNLKPGEPLQLK